jgi:hypothetical protein
MGVIGKGGDVVLADDDSATAVSWTIDRNPSGVPQKQRGPVRVNNGGRKHKQVRKKRERYRRRYKTLTPVPGFEDIEILNLEELHGRRGLYMAYDMTGERVWILRQKPDAEGRLVVSTSVHRHGYADFTVHPRSGELMAKLNAETRKIRLTWMPVERSLEPVVISARAGGEGKDGKEDTFMWIITDPGGILGLQCLDDDALPVTPPTLSLVQGSISLYVDETECGRVWIQGKHYIASVVALPPLDPPLPAAPVPEQQPPTTGE